MTQEELQVRIEKKNNDIAKIEKRIAKWSKGMNEEAKRIASECELVYDDPKYHNAYANYKLYADAHKRDRDVYSDDWNKGPQLDELYRAYRDLAEAKATLNKYLVQMDAKKNFDNMEKIEVIWNFLQNWKKNVIEFVIKNAKEYYELQQKENEEEKKYFDNLTENEKESCKKNWNATYHYRHIFKERYYSDISSITKQFYKYRGGVDSEGLNKYLDKDVEAKYKNLVARITEIAGEIQDASMLYIANNGEINGVVIGTKGRARVETITAGGYNIQILHYRTLVHKIK